MGTMGILINVFHRENLEMCKKIVVTLIIKISGEACFGSTLSITIDCKYFIAVYLIDSSNPNLKIPLPAHEHIIKDRTEHKKKIRTVAHNNF